MVKVKQDLSGQRFGRLVVVRQAEDYINPNTKKRFARWLCRCDCKKEIVVLQSSLKSENTKSCGYLQSESVSKSNRKHNKYNLTEEYGVGYTSKGEEFYFDLDDYDKIKDYCWIKSKNGYIFANVHKTTNEKIYMHRLIVNCTNDMFIDHINHRKHDNRKLNLRIVNKNQNMMNQVLRNNNAYITKNNKRMTRGYYSDYEDAVKARKEAEEKYFGAYSYDNSMSMNTDKAIC